METIFKSVSLGFLLRSVFAGAFFVLTYGVATKDTCAAIHVHSDNLFFFWLGVRARCRSYHLWATPLRNFPVAGMVFMFRSG